jgi:hypothetical protein
MAKSKGKRRGTVDTRPFARRAAADFDILLVALLGLGKSTQDQQRRSVLTERRRQLRSQRGPLFDMQLAAEDADMFPCDTLRLYTVLEVA